MLIDLRSDTVTRPTPAMREAIARAEVGDDIYGEDPSVNQLEAHVAAWLGKEAAVYNCSGTQSNQMAIFAHCQPGDEVLLDETAHIANYEAGAPAVLSGVTLRTLRGDGTGRFDVADLEGKVRPDSQHHPITRLVCLENTTNIGGGRVWPLAQAQRVAAWARERRLKIHVDGARLLNATIAAGYSARDFADCADTVSLCFSKGLGCPIGSILVGDAATIARARRARKLFGGALRQVGMMAAAATYAFKHHVQRLADDHRHARLLAIGLAQIPGIIIRPETLETNIVFFDIASECGPAAALSKKLKAAGVLINATGPQRLRACTHLDVSAEQIPTAVDIIRQCLSTPR